MKKKRLLTILLFLVVMPMSTIAAQSSEKQPGDNSNELITSKAPIEHVQAQMDKFSPILLDPDISYLPRSEQQALSYLIKAAGIIDELFREQVYSKNQQLLRELETYIDTPEEVYYHYFKLMQGPWDRIDGNTPFINLDQTKPDGANFYPLDMTKEEFTAWIEANPDQADQFTSPFTMIRRDDQNDLEAVAYSRFFRKKLLSAATLLQKAARKTQDQSLATYLKSRAKAFLSNDYRQSDVDWIGLDGDIEATIGPYEVYEDELFNYKAAFEAFICLVDPDESQKLAAIETLGTELMENYPLPEGLTISPKGLASPIKVVNEVYSAGDARAGVATIAFNLPNDEWVRENVGSKNVMIKNMLEAKYDGVLTPIKDLVLAQQDRDKPSFDAFFNYVLMHELSHGLAPGTITVNGTETTVRMELKELYSTIEECQADTLSIYNTLYLTSLADSPMPEGLEQSLFASYLAGMFRSIRFGTDSAHGGAITIQLNYHMENGGFIVDDNGLFYLDQAALNASVDSLAERLLAIEITGDYAGAKELIDTYQYVSPQVQAALDRLEEVPVDVAKAYPYDQ